MKTLSSRHIWEMHIWKWQQSKGSIADYCRENDLKSASFYKWKSFFSANEEKTTEQKIGQTQENDFVQVNVGTSPPKQSQESIKLSFTSQAGDALTIESKDADLVMKVCNLLRAR